MVKRIKGGAQTGPDRGGARGRELLAADNMRKAHKSGLAPAQRRHAGHREYRLKPRVLLQQRLDRGFEIGLAVEVEGHSKDQPAEVVMRGHSRSKNGVAFAHLRPAHPSHIVKDTKGWIAGSADKFT